MFAEGGVTTITRHYHRTIAFAQHFKQVQNKLKQRKNNTEERIDDYGNCVGLLMFIEIYSRTRCVNNQIKSVEMFFFEGFYVPSCPMSSSNV